MITELAQKIVLAAKGHSRFILGISGAPGSGKSTLAAKLTEHLPNSALLPMDGFHLDDSLLEARGRLKNKGAPDTFDSDGYVTLLKRIKNGESVIAPKFDRDLEISRAGAIDIPSTTHYIITEGNYLLLAQNGWKNVAPLLDAKWFISLPESELEKRLTQRWEGYNFSKEAITEKLEKTDLPNARLVTSTQKNADFVIDGLTLTLE